MNVNTSILSADGVEIKKGDIVYSIISGEKFYINHIDHNGWAHFLTKDESPSHGGNICWYAKSKMFALQKKSVRLLKEVNDCYEQYKAKQKEYLSCVKSL